VGVRIVSSERGQASEPWGLDDELQWTERLTEMWESHADMHQGTAYGEAITKVARGYRLQLEALCAARETSGPATASDPWN
jgi:hypothetical protein